MARRGYISLICVLAVAAAVMFVNLGSARLWDRDEPRNAGCALEMMQRGDWIVPTFNDELRHQKPVLLYWMIGSAYAMFGVNEFAARFWSAMFALGTVGCTLVIAKRLYGSASATLSALVLATSLMFVVAGRAATPDSLLIFFQTLALAFFVCGTFAAPDGANRAAKLAAANQYFPPSKRFACAMYAAMGFAVLTKGPVGFVMPMAIIGLFLLIKTAPAEPADLVACSPSWRRILFSIARCLSPLHFAKTILRMRPFLGAAIVLAIALPWFVLVGLRTEGEFLRRFLWEENIGRATSTLENHGGGLWYYPLAMAIGFFPWSTFLGPMLIGTCRQLGRAHPFSDANLFLLCWIGVQVGLFSLASTKLPSYVTPCYPALAICCGFTLTNWSSDKERLAMFWGQACWSTLALVGLAISAALYQATRTILAGDFWLIALGLVWVAVAMAGWFHLGPMRRPRMLIIFQFAAAVFCIGLFGFGTVAVDRLQQADRLLGPIHAQGAPVAAYRCLESSWVFYAGQPIYELAVDADDADASWERQKIWQRKPRLNAAAFAAQRPDAYFITTNAAWEELKLQLPAHYRVIENVPYFLRNKELVLVAPETSVKTADVRVGEGANK